MPTFDFSLSKKKISKEKTIKANNRFEIILKNVKGIIWINEKAIYSVKTIDGKKYPIDSKCYSCKNHARIYRRNVPFNDRYIYIRSVGDYTEQNPNLFLPFAPGCIVVGNIVRNQITKIISFIIKDCWTESDNELSHQAIVFYKEHINEINDVIKTKQLE